MTRVYCKIDGKFAVFHVESDHIELSRNTIEELYQVQGAVLAIVK